jgi:hypothetical protein
VRLSGQHSPTERFFLVRRDEGTRANIDIANTHVYSITFS